MGGLPSPARPHSDAELEEEASPADGLSQAALSSCQPKERDLLSGSMMMTGSLGRYGRCSPSSRLQGAPCSSSPPAGRGGGAADGTRRLTSQTSRQATAIETMPNSTPAGGR